MNYDMLLVPQTYLKGIDDRSNEACGSDQKPVKISSHKGKRDKFVSFPRGLPNIPNIKE